MKLLVLVTYILCLSESNQAGGDQLPIRLKKIIAGQLAQNEELSIKDISGLFSPLENTKYLELIHEPSEPTMELLKSDRQITPFHILVTENRENDVKKIVSRNKAPSPKTFYGATPLTLACNARLVRMQLILCGRSPELAERPSIVVDLERQLMTFSDGGKNLRTFQVSTGKPDTPTRPGTYVITQKLRINRTQSGAVLSNFQRLSNESIGIHSGYVKVGFASSGCIRVKESDANLLFTQTQIGDVVQIE